MGKAFQFVLAGLLAAAPQIAFGASSADLINAALNQNLEEREQVTGAYEQNEAADRPEFAAANRGDETRITVEVESGIASISSRPLRNRDNSARIYRETRVEAKLDKEVKAVDREMNRANTLNTNVNHGG